MASRTGSSSAFDPHHDHLTGSMFSVTAAGSVGDGMLFNDSGEDETWDGVWDAAVTIDDKGWTAEMRIPFSQLRFSAADRQVWGFHAVRMIQRKNEETWWSLVPKKEEAVVSRMGELDGLDGIRQPPPPRAAAVRHGSQRSHTGRPNRATRSTTAAPARPRRAST